MQIVCYESFLIFFLSSYLTIHLTSSVVTVAFVFNGRLSNLEKVSCKNKIYFEKRNNHVHV